MHDIYLLSPFIVFFLSFIILIYSKLKMKKSTLHELEQGLEPVYSVICTVFLDGKRHIFTRFTIYDDMIVISNNKKIILRFDDINNVSVGKSFFGTVKFAIDHKNDNAPTISLLLKDTSKPKMIIQNKLDHKASPKYLKERGQA